MARDGTNFTGELIPFPTLPLVDRSLFFGTPRPRTSEITLSLLKRAKANGFTALVITVDSMALGWRPHDIETAYLPFAYGVGVQVGTSDPVFMKRFGLEPRQAESTPFPFEPEKVREAAVDKGDEDASRNMLLGKSWLGEVNSGAFRTWEDLKFIRDNWDGPIVLKGIQSVSVSCIRDRSWLIPSMDVGCIGCGEGDRTWNRRNRCFESWYVVCLSRLTELTFGTLKGGRQLDGAIGSLDALDKIIRSPNVRAAQESGKLSILFDSGIRTGSDIIKALAIGAQAVLSQFGHCSSSTPAILTLNSQSHVRSCMALLSRDRKVSSRF